MLSLHTRNRVNVVFALILFAVVVAALRFGAVTEANTATQVMIDPSAVISVNDTTDTITHGKAASSGLLFAYVVNSNGDTNAVNLVTGTDAGGNITLRSAIQAATAQPGSHTITFSGGVVSPINLTLGQITVGNAANGNNITISGPGMNSLTVNQTTENRIFSTGTGAVTFLLQNITLNYTGPAVTPYSGGGGAIIAGGAGASTTLINCRISNFQRQIGNGGAISASSSLANHSLTITNSIFTNNRAGGGGGAVSFNSQGGTATITGNIFDNNHTGPVGANTGGDGGAVNLSGGGSGGTYFVERNTFLNNQVENVTGHAGAIMSTNGTATIRYNRFIGNTCANVAFPPLANIVGQAGGATTHVTIANDNWWGVNTGPGANDATALAAGAVMTLTQWLQLRDVISGVNVHNTNQIAPGTNATFTADIRGLNTGGSTAAANLTGLLTFPSAAATIYTNVSPSLATSFTPTAGQYVNGAANTSAVFTSNGTKGTATINSVADNQTLGTPLVIGFTPVFVNPAGNDSVASAFTSNACGGAGFQPCFATIGAALVNVAVGGVINIQSGTYAENPNFNQNCTTNITGNITLNGITLTNGTFNASSFTTTLASSNFTNNGGTFTQGTSTFALTPGAGAQTIGGTTPTTFNNLTINNASGVNLGNSETVGGTLTLTNGVLGVGTNTLTLNGPVSFTSGTIGSGSTGTVNYNKSSNVQDIAPGNYGNLTFSNFTKTLPNGATVRIAGAFTTGAAGGHTVTGSTVEFNGTSAQTLPSNFTTYNNLHLNNSVGTTGFAGLTVQGLIRVMAGTFTSSSTYKDVQIDPGATLAGVNATTINVSGNWTNNGTFTANTNTVNFNGSSGTQTVSGNTTFYNLTIANTGATIAFGATNTTVANTLSRTAGTTMDPGTGTFTFTGVAGSITGAGAKTFNNLVINAGATISNATGGNLTVRNNFTNNGTFTQAAGITTTFDASNPVHNFAGGGATTFGSVVINSGTAIDAGSHNFSVGGANFTVTGTFTGNTGTVTFIGTIAQTLGANGAKNFNNLTINNGVGGSVVTTGSSPSVAGLLLIQAGSFTTAGSFNNVQINSGATLAAIAGSTINATGNWVNNGTFNPGTGTINFNGASPQTFNGSFNNLSINNASGTSLNGSTTVNGTFLANGTLNVGSNTLTLNSVVSGSSSIISNANGTVNYNQSSNGQNVLPGTYGNLIFSNFTKILPNPGAVNIAGAFTTGAAGGHTVTGSTVVFNGASSQTLPAGFTPYNNLTVNNSAGIILAGNTTVDGGLTLMSGNINAGVNTLTIGTGGSATQTSGHVIGTMTKLFGGVGSFTFPLGTTGTTAYSPLNVTVTNGTGQLTARANTGIPAILLPISARTLQRYWTLSGSGIRSNITFNYLDGDVPGAPNDESIWNIIRVTGSIAVRYPPTLPYVIMNPGANTFTINDLESYSDWTAGEPLAPTAANANVSGRVLDANGRGVFGGQVSMRNQEGQIFWATTNPFGYYRFVNIPAGQVYIVSPRHKRFEFQPRTINLADEITGLDFIAEP